jgi:hypothetical protein
MRTDGNVVQRSVFWIGDIFGREQYFKHGNPLEKIISCKRVMEKLEDEPFK